MFAAAGRVAVPKLFGLEHPRTVIQNEPAPIGAREQRSDVGHQHHVLARNHERERPVLSSKTKVTDRDLRGFDGGNARTTRGAGIPKGHPPWGAPLVAPKA